MEISKIPWDPLKCLFAVDDAIQQMLYYEWSFFFRQERNYADVSECMRMSLMQCQAEGIRTTPSEHLGIVDLIPAREQMLVQRLAVFDSETDLRRRSWTPIEHAMAFDPNNPIYSTSKTQCLFCNPKVQETYKLAFNEMGSNLTSNNSKFKNFEIIRRNLEQMVVADAKCNMLRKLHIIRCFEDLNADIVVDERLRWLNSGGRCEGDILHSVSDNGKGRFPLAPAGKFKKDFGVISKRVLDREFRVKIQQEFKLNSAIALCNLDICYECFRNMCDCVQIQLPHYSITYMQLGPAKGNNGHKLSVKAAHKGRDKAPLKSLDELNIKRCKINNLTNFMDIIMTNFYSLITRRIFPRNFEFMYEIFNIYGLSLLNALRVPGALDKLTAFDALLQTLDSAPNRLKWMAGRNTGSPLHEKAIKEKVLCLQKRAQHAIYPGEKCYLYYTMACLNCIVSNFEDAQYDALKVLCIFSEECQNMVWKFLSLLILQRVNVVRRQNARLAKCLALGRQLAHHLDDATQTYYSVVIYYTEQLLRLAVEPPSAPPNP